MGVQKTVSVNPNNQKEMNEETIKQVTLLQRMSRHLSEQLVAAMDRINELTPEGELKVMVPSVEDCLLEAELRFTKPEDEMSMEERGFTPAPDGYQPEPDIHDIEMVGSELWIKDKE